MVAIRPRSNNKSNKLIYLQNGSFILYFDTNHWVLNYVWHGDGAKKHLRHFIVAKIKDGGHCTDQMDDTMQPS